MVNQIVYIRVYEKEAYSLDVMDLDPEKIFWANLGTSLNLPTLQFISGN